MKKILLIAPTDLPIPATKGGAVETGIEQLINENEVSGKVQFEVYSYFEKEAYEKSKKMKNTKFIFYNSNFLDKFYIFVFKVINKILQKMHINKNFNIRPKFIRFVCKNISSSKYSAILIKNAIRYVEPISKVNTSPIILQLHNDFLNNTTPDCNKIVEICSKIVANSEYIKNRVKTISNVNESNIYTNLNCLDNSNFIEANKKERENVISKYNIDITKKNIIFVGRIVAQKGVKELLLALEQLKDNNNWHLLIAGGKWFSDSSKDKYHKELDKISNTFKERITFLGYINHYDIKTLYSLSDIAVVPSIWEEPAGRVVLEAQAMGIPVIASNAGGIPEYVDSKSAIIIDRGVDFINNLSNKIEYLLNNDDKRIEMGNYGKTFAKEFTSFRYYNEILAIMGVDKNE